jgi:hypothetical protein
MQTCVTSRIQPVTNDLALVTNDLAPVIWAKLQPGMVPVISACYTSNCPSDGIRAVI